MALARVSSALATAARRSRRAEGRAIGGRARRALRSPWRPAHWSVRQPPRKRPPKKSSGRLRRTPRRSRRALDGRRSATRASCGNMPGPLVVSRTVAIPESELRWRFSRSSGPGGQSVNTTDSRVELSWDVATSVALGPVLRQRTRPAAGAPRGRRPDRRCIGAPLAATQPGSSPDPTGLGRTGCGGTAATLPGGQPPQPDRARRTSA